MRICRSATNLTALRTPPLPRVHAASHRAPHLWWACSTAIAAMDAETLAAKSVAAEALADLVHIPLVIRVVARDERLDEFRNVVALLSARMLVLKSWPSESSSGSSDRRDSVARVARFRHARTRVQRLRS